jgi:hypothetical protein
MRYTPTQKHQTVSLPEGGGWNTTRETDNFEITTTDRSYAHDQLYRLRRVQPHQF